MNTDQLIEEIKKFAIEIYRELGAGYEETIYEEAMAIELRNKKIPYEVERNTEVFYKGIKVGINRLDFIVDGKLVVELKAQNSITKSHEGQTRSYLKSMNLRNGLIVNFPYPDKDEPDFQEITL
ncbi:MAG: GxxExxY protein [Nitrosopumilaceae archaeon]